MTIEMTELTYREKQIISFIKNGFTNGQIAVSLCTSKKTIETTLTRLYEKTGCTNRTQLAIKAVETNLFTVQNVA